MQVIRKDLHATRFRESAARLWCGCGRGGRGSRAGGLQHVGAVAAPSQWRAWSLQ